MRGFFKSFFSLKPKRIDVFKGSTLPSRTAARNISPQPPNKPLHNPLTKPTDRTNPLGFPWKPGDLGFLQTRRMEEKELERRNKWLEKWYKFRDTWLVYPIERLVYLLRVVLAVLLRLLKTRPSFRRGLEKIDRLLDDAQRNPTVRTLFFPLVMLGLLYCMSKMFVFII